MKTIKIITHPAAVIVSFLIIIISGEHFGGFYLIYLLLALPHGGVHAILGLSGIALLVFCNSKFRRKHQYIMELLINVAGVLCMVLSLLLFFYNDKSGYNDGTFGQAVPLTTLVLFGLLAVGFLLSNLILYSSPNKPGNLSVS